MAHEINNPLTFVSSNLRHLEELRVRGEACDPQELTQIHGETLEGVRRIHQIVRDLKTFARDDTSDGDTSSAVEAVAEALRLGRPKLHGGVRVIDEVPSQLATVRFGQGRFVKVVLNLLTNAVDAAATGAANGPEIRIGAKEQGDTVVLHVEDNGPGIPEHVRSVASTSSGWAEPSPRRTGQAVAPGSSSRCRGNARPARHPRR